MTLVNETGQAVYYWITSTSSTDCGKIDVDGIADLPGYDNQTNVEVQFLPLPNDSGFSTTVAETGTGMQIEMALVAL
jgi:hypothetical protein